MLSSLSHSIQHTLARRTDRWFLLTVFALAATSVFTVFSASAYLVETKMGGAADAFLFRQLLRVGAALVVMGVASMIDYRWLAKGSLAFLVVAIGLLVAVQIAGEASGGAQRWLDFAGVSVQPSDLAKVALILHIAKLLAQKQAYIQDFARAYVPLVLWIGLTLALIGMEDLSTALIVFCAVGAMCLIGRVRLLHLSGTGALVLVLAFAFLASSPERAKRLEAWTGVKMFSNTEEAEVFDDQAEGYQARQARIAVAVGGLTGVGPGKSVQRDFLPAPYNDFIFAIIAEEYGLLGATVLLALFFALLFRGFLRIARGAPDPFGLFLAAGLTTALVLYGFVNAGVASGLLPVTGLPMPFVSYGGSSTVATGLMVGILLNVARHSVGTPGGTTARASLAKRRGSR
ncbi:MAG: putative peptidoglycan glycosyltransferase FtsW [Bacteroidota bacterium]